MSESGVANLRVHLYGTQGSGSLFPGRAERLAVQRQSERELLKLVFEDLAPKFEATTKHKVVVTYGLAAALKQRIEGGEAFDVAFVTPAVMDDLIAHGRISADTAGLRWGRTSAMGSTRVGTSFGPASVIV